MGVVRTSQLIQGFYMNDWRRLWNCVRLAGSDKDYVAVSDNRIRDEIARVKSYNEARLGPAVEAASRTNSSSTTFATVDFIAHPPVFTQLRMIFYSIVSLSRRACSVNAVNFGERRQIARLSNLVEFDRIRIASDYSSREYEAQTALVVK